MAREAKTCALGIYALNILPNRRNAPNSRKVLEIRSITLFRSLSTDLSVVALAKMEALAKADALMALWPKNPRNLFTPLETCLLFLMGRNPWLINDLRPYKALYNCRDISTNVMSALQIKPFMQNKANFLDALMNVTSLITVEYENISIGHLVKTKPIQSQSKPIKANSKPILTQNKANSKPIKPNFKGASTR